MPLLAILIRLLAVQQIFGPPRHARRGHRRHRRSGGFGMWGPMPYYSRRTRGGGRVSVGGCCLPIPLALTVVLAAGARLFARR